MIYLVKGLKMVHKRHSNQRKSSHLNAENDALVDVDPMKVVFYTFEVLTPRKALERKIEKKTKYE